MRRIIALALPALLALVGILSGIGVARPATALAEPPLNPTEAPRAMIVSVGSGKCADAPNKRSQVQIYQYTCHGRDNQRWTFVKTRRGGEYKVVNADTGKCLDVYGNHRSNGTRVIQANCHGRANQRWLVTMLGREQFTLKSVNAGKCLDVTGASRDNEAGFIVWACHKKPNQRWISRNATAPSDGSITRAEILDRARNFWGGLGNNKVPYSMSTCYDTTGRKTGGAPCNAGSYRADCAGYVAMAWNTVNATVGSTNPALTPLAGNPSKSHRIQEHELQPGDALAYYEGPGANAHIVLFVRWADRVGGAAVIWEQAGGALGPREDTWTPAERRIYQAFRYNNLR
ncbi:MAG TPA: RICIN domain-containing protein [Pseudonocardiaceae bacterium]